MKALVGAFNQEKALVGAFSVIVQLHRLIVYTALVIILRSRHVSAPPDIITFTLQISVTIIRTVLLRSHVCLFTERVAQSHQV